MTDERKAPTGNDLYLHRASATSAAARTATSPQAVESALSRISSEMMEEAIARRERAASAAATLRPGETRGG